MFNVEKDWFTKAGLRAVCIWLDGCRHRCGYVGLTKEHPLYNKGYSEHCDCLLPLVEKRLDSPVDKMGPILLFCCTSKEPSELNRPEIIFEVHGSLTFSGGDEKYPVKEKDIWWFGFDCGHSGDASKYSGGIERTTEYVVDECESLAKQLKEIV